MSKKLRKCLSLVLAGMLLASISLFGTLNASADYKTGDGLAAYAMTAYNEGWRYVWGGASYGAVDCSGLIYSYVGGGARVTEDMLYSSPESGYVANGVPDIPGLALWQPGHVGVYVGGGMAVDARDEISNVCYSAVSSKSWVMWFKVAGVDYGDVTSEANDNQNTEQTDFAKDTESAVDNSVSDVLSLGSHGKDVNALQERLKELGFFSDNTTDYFGEVTQSALKEFQTAAGFTPDGILTEEVKTALYADDAPAKSISSNVNPEESEESDTEETDIVTEPETAAETETTEYAADTDSTDDTQTDTEEVLELTDTQSSEDTENTDNTDESDLVSEDLVFGFGDDDEEITNIQYILMLLGYYDYDLTSTYDENTAYAVAQYQLDNDLNATGNVDKKTYDSLYGVFGGDKSESDTQTDSETAAVTAVEEDRNAENDQIVYTTYEENENSDYETVVRAEESYEDTDVSFNVQLSQASGTEPGSDVEEQTSQTLTAESESDNTDTEADEVSAFTDTTSDTQSGTDTAAVSSETASTDTTAETKSTDTAQTTVQTKPASSTSTGAVAKGADVPKTGVILLYPKTVAAIGIIVSLMIIFFAANVHYWNISMEKRRQRERRAASVSAYRRSSR